MPFDNEWDVSNINDINPAMRDFPLARINKIEVDHHRLASDSLSAKTRLSHLPVTTDIDMHLDPRNAFGLRE